MLRSIVAPRVLQSVASPPLAAPRDLRFASMCLRFHDDGEAAAVEEEEEGGCDMALAWCC